MNKKREIMLPAVLLTPEQALHAALNTPLPRSAVGRKPAAKKPRQKKK
ncbi:MAG: hypothetical protein HY290_21260 [Planctomycetia bacterium]|nr:hypothetical protein [Planctomycetia bacterium]